MRHSDDPRVRELLKKHLQDHVLQSTIAVLENAEAHKALWCDRGDAYWLARLVNEVGMVAFSIADANAVSTEQLLTITAGICLNWIYKIREETQVLGHTNEILKMNGDQ